MKNVRRAALTGGIIWSATVFLCTWASIGFGGYAGVFLNWVGSIYPGYSITPMGSLIGAVYGFFDMYVAMYVIDWVYRRVK